MHDISWFETEGVPAVAVVTDGFAQAAATQSRALGMPDLKVVTVPHPVQNLTDDEVAALATGVYARIVRALVEPVTEAVPKTGRNKT